jgi:ferredoxin-NADP reductase
MLRTLCDEGHAGPVTYLHYAAGPDRMPYGTTLARIAATHPNVRVLRVFRREPQAGELQGRFGRAQLSAAEPHYAEAEAFVCGPDRLIDAVRSLFREEGLTGRLHLESFTPLRTRACRDGSRSRVHCERSGLEIEGDGRTLLELAEAAGLEPSYGCRRGICHTCVRRMRAGTVRHVVSGATLDAAGLDVQLCVQVPVGDVHIDL